MRKKRMILAAAAMLAARVGFASIMETYVGPDGGSWTTAGNWSPIGIPSNNGQTYAAGIDGPVNVVVSTPVAVDAVTLGTASTLTLGSTLTLAGPMVTSSGKMIVGSGGALMGAGELYLMGSGTVTLSDPGAVVASVTGGRVTNFGVVRGMGTLGSAVTNVTNAGTVSADGGILNVAAGTHVNTGLMRAVNGGLLTVAGAVANTGGVMEAGTGSVVEVDGSVTGGVVRAVNGGSVSLSGASLAAVALAGASFVKGSLGLSGAIGQTGVMTVASGSSVALQGDVTLSGGGSLVLGGSVPVGGANGLKLTTDQVMSGSASFNNLVLSNSGTISATTGGMYLSLASTAASVNTGVIRAAGANSFVQFQNGLVTLNNTGGVLEATNGATLYLAGTITGGIVRSTGTGRMQFQSGGTLTGTGLSGSGTVSAGVLLSNVATSATLAVTSGSIGVSANIVNTGTMQFYNGARLMLGGDTVLSGGGAVTFPTGSGGVASNNSSFRLTTDNVISGFGYWNNANLSNSGTITSSGSSGFGSLGISFPSGSLTNYNTGLLRATNGTLVLGGYGATLNNYTGVIEALNGATVAINNGLIVQGGTLKTSATGTISLTSGTLQSVTLTGNTSVGAYTNLTGVSANSGVMTIASFGSLGLAGSLANTGTMQLTANGGRLVLTADEVLSGRGTIVMNANTAIMAYAFSPKLTTDQFISAGNGSLTNMTLINSGTISVGTGTLVLTLSGGGGTLTSMNSGVMRANGGTLTMSNSSVLLDNTGGVIEALDNSVLNLSGTITGGTVRSVSNGTVTLANGVLNGVALAGNLTLLSGSEGLAGVINQTGTVTVANSAQLSLISDTTLAGHGSVVLGGAYARIGGSGQTRLTTDNAISGQGTLTGMVLANSGTITATTGTLTVNMTTSLPSSNSGALRADGGVLKLLLGGTGGLQNGGLIEAADGSGVEVADSGAGPVVTGGTLRSLGSGSVTLSTTGTVLESVATSGNVVVPSLGVATFRSTLANTGVISVQQGGTFRLASDVMLTGNGTVTLAGAMEGGNLVPAPRLTSFNTITGAGLISVPVTNMGTLTGTGGTLVLQPAGSGMGIVSPGKLLADNGTIQFNNGTQYLSGVIQANNNGALLFSGGMAVISSSVTLANGLMNFATTGNSATTIAGTGTLVIGSGGSLTADRVDVSTLQVEGALTLRNGTSGTASKVSLLVPSGTINMNTNTITLQSTPAGQVQTGPSSDAGKAATLAELAGRIAAGAITTTAAPNMMLALADNADLHWTTFMGQQVDETCLFMTPALVGDANLDGQVDLGDYDRWYSHVGSGANAVTKGDFNLDGQVDLGDYDLWYSHVGASAPPLVGTAAAGGATLSAVPEPGTLAWLGAGLGVVLRRRRFRK